MKRLAAIAAAVFALGAAAAFADESFDQVNDPSTGMSVGCGSFVATIGQSFVPTRRLLTAAQLKLRAGGSSSGMTSELAVRRESPAGTEIGRTHALVAPASVGEVFSVRFDFQPPLVLDPQGPYALVWTTPGDRYLTWMASYGNPYPAGTAFSCNGGQIPDQDFSFATITPADSANPDTAIVSAPDEGSFSNDPAPVLQLGGSDDLSYTGALKYTCTLDRAPLECAELTRLELRGDGLHQFEARATDESGRADASPETRSWTLDTTIPRMPRLVLRGRVARITAVDPDGAADRPHLLCGIDGRRLTKCPAALNLRPGRHLVRAVSVDRAGNRSTTLSATVAVR